MRLEGTLDAFSLPDIFQLLSFTKKTGALHLRRAVSEAGPQLHGVVHVRNGAVTGARSDAGRQELARRLVGTGLVDDEALASAAEELADDPSAPLGRLLAEKADLEAGLARRVAAEQVTDAVFDLLRWPDGEFAFVVDEPAVDDLGAELEVEALVAEARQRLAAWPSIVEQVPAADAAIRLNPAPPAEATVTADEWPLLSLVDGRRTVADLVALAGRGEYAVVTSIATLVSRGLLVVGEPGEDKLLRRHQLLAALEGSPVTLDPEPAAETPPVEAASVEAPPVAAPAVPAPAAREQAVIPPRPEPFTPPRRPEYPETVPVRAQHGTVTSIAGHGSVNGATAMQPDAVPAHPGVVDRDPNVNKSLLLRLIAGVRGL